MSKVLVIGDGGAYELDLVSGTYTLKIPMDWYQYSACFVNNLLYMPMVSSLKVYDSTYTLVNTINYPSDGYMVNPHQCTEHQGSLYIADAGQNKIVMYNLTTHAWTEFSIPDIGAPPLPILPSAPPALPEGTVIIPPSTPPQTAGTVITPTVTGTPKLPRPDTDLNHINSVFFDNSGLMYVIAHNYGRSSVLVYNNFVQQSKLDVGNLAHSPFYVGSDIWICDSAKGRLTSLTGTLNVVNGGIGFTRGAAVNVDGTYSIGSSNKKYADTSIPSFAGVILLNSDLSLNQTFPFTPGNTIGEVVTIPSSFI